MIIKRKIGNRGNRIRQAAALVVVLALALFSYSVQGQTQRKPKGPPPPSYDDVLQRAMSQKKATSNAPTATSVTGGESISQPPASTAQPTAVEGKTTNEPASSQASAGPTVIKDPDLKSPTSPPPATNAQLVVPPAPGAAVKTAPNPATAVTPELVKPAQAPPKGPVFSPLPNDLTPTNEAPKNNRASAGSATSEATTSMGILDDKHHLAKGDRVSFRIVEDEEESKSLVVADSGELELPNSLGRFAAAGKSCRDLAQTIKSALEKEYYYHATVILAVDLMARTRGRVYIVGAVRAPGPQEIPSDEVLTLSKAIVRAGDFTDFANRKAVKVTRKKEGGGDQTFLVNVGEIIEKGRTELDLPLEPGDVIYVEEKIFRL